MACAKPGLNEIGAASNVRYLPKADIPYVAFDVAFGGKADMTLCAAYVCF